MLLLLLALCVDRETPEFNQEFRHEPLDVLRGALREESLDRVVGLLIAERNVDFGTEKPDGSPVHVVLNEHQIDLFLAQV